MQIERAQIYFFKGEQSTVTREGVFHKKLLPYFSVVQALEGSYGIALEEGVPFADTGEGGIFLAPPYKTQRILHRLGKDGIMRMRWVFLGAEVNGMPLEAAYDFPLLLPAEYCRRAGELLREIRESDGCCLRLGRCYELLDLLLRVGVPRTLEHEKRPGGGAARSVVEKIKDYVEENFASPTLTAEEIAEHFFLSRTTVYRMFAVQMGTSPSAYITRVRLHHAAAALLACGSPVSEIAGQCGFGDIFYFSKLFKKEFSLSPREYRREALTYGEAPGRGSSEKKA